MKNLNYTLLNFLINVKRFKKSHHQNRFKITSVIVILLSLTFSLKAANETFTSGAYIINMGQSTQTKANGLKPYGLVYDLLVNENIPISWAINPSKSKDGIDFTIGSTDYKGGSFIIAAEYVDANVITKINNWKAKGVVVNGPISSSFTAPIYDQISSWPNAILDEDNGGIVAKYYQAAEIPEVSYTLKGNPTLLDDCDDIYVLPHADPQKWDVSWQQGLLDFVQDGGYLWAACHAVSALETLVDINGDNIPDLDFLSDGGLIEWGDHGGGTDPYTYDPAYDSDPIMQFLGSLDAATTNGSEEIYLTPLTGNWRASTNIAVYDPDHPETNAGDAAIIAYGHAFGNTSYGMVMYEAGHDHGGDKVHNIAAQRAYFNFILLAGINKEINSNTVLPTQVASGATINLSASGSGGSSPYTYEWTSSCGGTFTSPNSATTSFTAPTVSQTQNCYIQVKVTDNCGRFSLSSSTIQIVLEGPTAVDDEATTAINTSVDIDILDNDIEGNGTLDPTSISFVSGTTPPTSEGVFTVNSSTGLVTFTPANNYTGTSSIDYEVCDDNSLCDVATITVTITGSISGPTANDDNASTNEGNPVDIDVLDNDTPGDASLDPTSVNLVSGTLPDPNTEGVFTVNPTTGLVTFTPAEGFSGDATVDYQVCDENSLCDIATITVSVAAGPDAINDIATTTLNTPVNIDVLDNDLAGDAAIDPTSVSFVSGTAPDPTTVGVFTVNSSTGLVTFTPVSGFDGTATINYEVCDVNSVCDIATILVSIPNEGDQDGDGVVNDDDDYPEDPERAFNNYYPAEGTSTLAYEDLWPGKGDYDFNDLVLDYRFNVVTNALNNVVEVHGTFTIEAFGAVMKMDLDFSLPMQILITAMYY